MAAGRSASAPAAEAGMAEGGCRVVGGGLGFPEESEVEPGTPEGTLTGSNRTVHTRKWGRSLGSRVNSALRFAAFGPKLAGLQI